MCQPALELPLPKLHLRRTFFVHLPIHLLPQHRVDVLQQRLRDVSAQLHVDRCDRRLVALPLLLILLSCRRVLRTAAGKCSDIASPYIDRHDSHSNRCSRWPACITMGSSAPGGSGVRDRRSNTSRGSKLSINATLGDGV